MPKKISINSCGIHPKSIVFLVPRLSCCGTGYDVQDKPPLVYKENAQILQIWGKLQHTFIHIQYLDKFSNLVK